MKNNQANLINRIYFIDIGGLGAQFPGKNKLMKYIKYQHRAAQKVEARKRKRKGKRKKLR